MKNKFLNILFLLIVISSSAQSQIVLTLKKSFIESLQNKITIKSDFNFDKANKKIINIKSGFYLGKSAPLHQDTKLYEDLIMSGSSFDIGFPVEAKIFNANHDFSTSDIISQYLNKKINLTGVWRIWTEYFGNDKIRQGELSGKLNDNTAEHIFEISPVTKFNDIELKGYNKLTKTNKIQNAENAFPKYSLLKCNISCDDSLITITTNGIGYDFVDFVLQLNDTSDIRDDGRFIDCNVFDNNNNLLVKNLRMVFIKNSGPEKAVRKLSIGDKLRVLGMPRFNLNEIYSRIKSSESNKEMLNYNLPYEMVIISVINK